MFLTRLTWLHLGNANVKCSSMKCKKKKRNNNKSFKSPNYSNQWWEAGTKGGTKVCDSFEGNQQMTNVFLMLGKKPFPFFLL